MMPPFVNSKPIYETIVYSPGLKDTGDLEAATKTITATSEAVGVGNADYSSAQTLAIPTNAKFEILRIASRLSVTIDSDDGTHDLRCRVYVDAQDANHLLYDLTYAATGNQLSVQDCLVGTKEVIFNLLKDGAAHTFYFFLWSPGNHSPVVSVVNLWFGLGATTATWLNVWRVAHTGLVDISQYHHSVGGANNNSRLVNSATSALSIGIGIISNQGTWNGDSPAFTGFRNNFIAGGYFGNVFIPGGATELAVVKAIFIVLRSDS